MQVQRVNIAGYQKVQTNQNPQKSRIHTVNNSLNIDSISFKATTTPNQTVKLLRIAARSVDRGATISPTNVDGWTVTFKPLSPVEYELGATKGGAIWTYICNPANFHADVYGLFPNGNSQGTISFHTHESPEILKLLKGLNLEN